MCAVIDRNNPRMPNLDKKVRALLAMTGNARNAKVRSRIAMAMVFLYNNLKHVHFSSMCLNGNRDSKSIFMFPVLIFDIICERHSPSSFEAYHISFKKEIFS